MGKEALSVFFLSMETEKPDDNTIFSGHISPHFSSTIKHFLTVCPFHFLQTIDSNLAPWITDGCFCAQFPDWDVDCQRTGPASKSAEFLISHMLMLNEQELMSQSKMIVNYF